MPRGALSTIIKIAIVSLVVGFVISFFGLTPQSVLQALGSTVRDVFEAVLNLFRWAFEYILIGAVVVVPIWLVFFLLRWARTRR